jgi:DNA-binding NtrC family response regulator
MSTPALRGIGALPRTVPAPLTIPCAPARILVVDDDPITGQFLLAIGLREGYQVVSVADGRQAFRMLKSDAGFAAAVFNVPMPNLNGVDLVRYMKTEKRLMRIPVVIVAGGHGLKLIADSFAAGALAFLPKPFTTEKLACTVRLAIGSGMMRKTQQADI